MSCPKCSSAYCSNKVIRDPQNDRKTIKIHCTDCGYRSDHVRGQDTKWEQLPGAVGHRVPK